MQKQVWQSRASRRSPVIWTVPAHWFSLCVCSEVTDHLQIVTLIPGPSRPGREPSGVKALRVKKGTYFYCISLQCVWVPLMPATYLGRQPWGGTYKAD